MSYTIIKYDNYTSKELLKHSEVERERNKALLDNVNEIEVIEYELNKQYQYSTIKTKYFHIGGRWKKIMS